MLVADLLIDAASKYEYISSVDGYAGYHQLRIATEGCNKTAFRCPKVLGLFEYVAHAIWFKKMLALHTNEQWTQSLKTRLVRSWKSMWMTYS